MLHEHHFRAMNTDVGVWLWSNRSSESDAAKQSLRWAEDLFRSVEAELSRFRRDSGLSQLNSAAGRGPQKVSPLLWTVLSLALEAASDSAGIFDPTLLRTMERIGYDRSFEKVTTIAAADALADRPMAGAWRCLRLDPISRCVLLPANLGVDLGGIAKGWTVDQVALTLARSGPVLVDAGGDMRAVGTIDGEAWPVAIQDPFAPERDQGVLRLAEGALATSSVGGRRWKRGRCTLHHLIDPRTGMPSDSDLHTVTVLASQAITADVAAKVVLVLGSSAGAEYMRGRGLSGLLTRTDGNEIVVGDLPREDLSGESIRVADRSTQHASSTARPTTEPKDKDSPTGQMTDMPAPGSVLLSTLAGMVLAVGGFAIGVGVSGITGETTAFWYLSRTSGFVSYLLLWGSVVWGLLLSTGSGRRWKRPSVLLDAHQFLGNVAVGFACFHGLILTGDRYLSFPLRAVLVPFASDYEPVLVAAGQIALWLSALLIASFYMRRQIGAKSWRRLHYVSFAVFLLALLHGYVLGSDARTVWATSVYLATAGAVVFLTVYRLLASTPLLRILAQVDALHES